MAASKKPDLSFMTGSGKIEQTQAAAIRAQKATATIQPEINAEKIMKLPLSEILPFEHNVHKVCRDEKYIELLENVRECGKIKVPVAVFQTPEHPDKYILRAGHRRVTVARELGMRTVPAYLDTSVDASDPVATFLAVWNDNDLHRNTKSTDRMRAILYLEDALRGSSDELLGEIRAKIADMIHIKPRMVLNYLALSRLPEWLIDWCDLEILNLMQGVSISTSGVDVSGEEWSTRYNQMLAESGPEVAAASLLRAVAQAKKGKTANRDVVQTSRAIKKIHAITAEYAYFSRPRSAKMREEALETIQEIRTELDEIEKRLQ